MWFWLWALLWTVGIMAVGISCENAEYRRREKHEELMNILRRRGY